MKRIVIIAVLALWLGAVTAVAGSLLTRHAAPLPGAEPVRLAAGFEMLRGPGTARVTAFHVLGGSCRCSKQIAWGLVHGHRPLDLEEHVLVVDDDDGAMRAMFQGTSFVVHDVKAEALYPHFGVAGVPVLVLAGRAAGCRSARAGRSSAPAW